jgi:hypothetical protein
MKTLKDYIVNENNFFKNLGIGMRSQIEKWLDEHKIKNYTINDDLTIDVDGYVDLRKYEEKHLPDYIQFRKVTKYFYIGYCPKLESLEGCPKEVGGSFYCYDCPKLKSLEGGPKEVGIDFSCSGCSELTSLEGCPKKVNGLFSCIYCGERFTQNDVKKYCNVKGKINV